MMEPETEAAFVARLRRGDEDAFLQVYEEYRPRLFSFMLRVVRRREVADELAQETWLRLAARAASLREDTRLEAWLFTVARNLCLSYWRTRGIEGFGADAPGMHERLKDERPSPERRTSSGELLERLEKAVARLPVRYREAILLVGVEGMAPADACAVCGITPEAMRKRLERARNMLAAELGLPRPRVGGAGGG
jgi:RNA polymerase sigma factor (sigma-70 family)